MLEYIGMEGENPVKLRFIDEESPKELEAVIERKLSKYYEKAYIDNITGGKEYILIILEINLVDDDVITEESISKQKNDFEKYYDDILEKIGASNQSLNQ